MNKILLVEDDACVQRMYQRFFVHQNYKIELASTGEDGLTKAKIFHPDLILLDMILPGINGLEVVEKLKGDAETNKIPILALTNVDEPEVEKTAKNLGVECYMVKADLTPQMVLSEVKKHLTS